MSRTILTKLALGVALVVATAPALTAYAENPPSAKDMAEAKKAFGEGKKLHDAGKLPEAIEKFQKSYFLSKNPLLLYNVALTMEEAGMSDIAVGYYKKFLADAPADAAQRPAAEDNLKALEAKLGGTTVATPGPGPGPGPGPAIDTGTKPVPEVRTPVVMKPAGTYAEADFQHQVVDTAPPGKPLDITAYVPEDSGWTVMLAFRTAGEGKFTMKTMKWRYKELVGRIPAPKMIGDSVQYYVEAKDQAGAVIARSGKSTSPNLVTLEAGASPRFYPDFSEDGEVKLTGAQVRARDDADNPLTGGRTTAEADEPAPGETTIPTEGPVDTGPVSKKITYLKWGTTAGAAALFAGSIVFYLQAGSNASALEDDTTKCGAPPCRNFDSYDQDLEDAGKRNDTVSHVMLGAGIVVGVAAGYFWYKTIKARKHGRTVPSTARGASDVDKQWAVVPALGEGFAGASATVGF